EVGSKGDSAGFRPRSEGGCDLGGQAGKIYGLLLQAQRTTLRERERAQVLGQSSEHPSLVEEGVELLLVGRIDAVDHALQVALNDRQWCAQLVGHVRQKAA